MRLLYVPLSERSIDQLQQLAARERRRPQDQAAFLLDQALDGQLGKPEDCVRHSDAGTSSLASGLDGSAEDGEKRYGGLG